MSLLTTTAEGLLRPEVVYSLVVQPTQAASVAYQTATTVPITSTSLRVPRIESDVQAKFTAEGAEIDTSDAVVSEIDCVPTKLAALTRISNELASDSSPFAAEVVGQSIARSMSRVVDQAWFAAATTNGPAGLESLVGHGAQTVTVTGSLVDLDPFLEAQSLIEQAGGVCTSFAADARTVLALSKLRKFTGDSESNEPLLSAGDATQPTRRVIAGVPIFPVIAGVIPVGQVWAVDKSKVLLVERAGATLEVDRSVGFTSDSLYVRSTLRVGMAYPHPASVVRIVSGGS